MSIIRTFHDRYEASYCAYYALEQAQMAKAPDGPAERVINDAMAACQAEQNAIRLAVLLQPPASQADAAILQYHIRVAHEMSGDGVLTDEEELALSVAIDTLFDFLCQSEDPQLAGIGSEFRHGAIHAHSALRMRTEGSAA